MIRRWLRALARRAGRTAPGRWSLRRTALAPPWMKTTLVERIATAMSEGAFAASDLLDTNLGLDSEFRLRIPASKPSLLYGRADEQLSERATLALARCLCREADAFLDVGANEGLFTWTLARSPVGDRQLPILAFEADPLLWTRLSSNLERSHLPARGYPLAVSDRIGRQTFYRDLDDDASGSLSDHFARQHATAPVVVETTTLSEVLRVGGFTRACVKVDVEGAGALVWDGLGPERSRVLALLLEVLEPEVRTGLPARIIRESGWSAYYIRDFDLVVSPSGDFDPRHPFYNWLFCDWSPERLADRLAGTPFRVVEPTHRGLAAAGRART